MDTRMSTLRNRAECRPQLGLAASACFGAEQATRGPCTCRKGTAFSVRPRLAAARATRHAITFGAQRDAGLARQRLKTSGSFRPGCKAGTRL